VTDILPEPKPEKKLRCGRLLDWRPQGKRTRFDMCGLEAGHDKTLEPTPHRGQYTDATWETGIDSEGHKTVFNVIDWGRSEEEQAAGGREAIAEGTGPKFADPLPKED
jgi:hypothetical protein